MIAFSLIMRYLAGIIIAYLLGSIPFGLLLAKWLAHVDVREYGSGNIGATNVSRAAGIKIGLLSGVLDFSKGLAAVFISRLIVGHSYVTAGRFSFGPLFGGAGRFSRGGRPQLVGFPQIPRRKKCGRLFRRAGGAGMVCGIIRRRSFSARRHL